MTWDAGNERRRSLVDPSFLAGFLGACIDQNVRNIIPRHRGQAHHGPQIGGLVSTRAGADADALRFVCFGAGGRGASELSPSRPACSRGAVAADFFRLKMSGTVLLGGGGGGDWSWDFEGLLVREGSRSSSEPSFLSESVPRGGGAAAGGGATAGGNLGGGDRVMRAVETRPDVRRVQEY